MKKRFFSFFSFFVLTLLISSVLGIVYYSDIVYNVEVIAEDSSAGIYTNSTTGTSPDTFWAVHDDGKIYELNSTFGCKSYNIISQCNSSFSTTGITSADPEEVVTNITDFWILFTTIDKIIQTNASGYNLTAGKNTNDFGCSSPIGLASNLSDFWVACGDDEFVYHLNSTYDNQTDGFSVSDCRTSPDLSINALTTNGSYFYLTNDDLGSDYHEICIFNSSGDYVDRINLDTADIGISGAMRGITTTDGQTFWVSYLGGATTEEQVAKIIKDTINPQINLTYPANTTYVSMPTQLNFTVSDNVNISGCWYTVNNGATNTSFPGGCVSGNNSVSGDIDSGYGSKTWIVYVNDTSNNINSSSVTFTVGSAPSMILSTPLNNSWTSSFTSDLTCNSTDAGGNLKNITAYLWSQAGSLDSIYPTTITGSSNSTTFTSAGWLIQGANKWNCYVCNSYDMCAWASSNFTLNIDNTNPLISFGTGTENNNANFSRNWIYINTTFTETNFQNITFSLYNDTGTVNQTTFTTATYFINFTNLVDANYTYEVNITDKANNKNSTGIRRTILDDTNPVVNIVYPIEGNTYSDATININYTVSDNLIGLSSCWYTNDSGVNNYTITCGNNITATLIDGSYTYVVYANDSVNNLGSDSVTFGISTTFPAIVLNSPSDNQFFNSGTGVYFNYTATDGNGLSTCILYGNWSGVWAKNYTWVSPSSGVMNFTTLTLPQGKYSFNVWCNDTLNNGGFSLSNNTLTIDTTYPSVIPSGFTPSVVYNEDDINFFVNVTDTYLSTVWIEINYTGTYQNISTTTHTGNTYEYTLSNSLTSNHQNISWYWYSNDSANNVNKSALSSFLVSNRNPYSINITNQNNTFKNSNWVYVNFTGTDLDLDTLNYSLYNSSDGVTFSLFNSTTNSFLNFSGFNYSEGSKVYFYINASDGYLSNISSTYVFTVDIVNPTISLSKPDASPIVYCSYNNIPLTYSTTDTNLDYCSFNVTSGGLISTPNTIISGCLNTTFNVSYDNAVQTLTLLTFDKAGNSNSTTRLIYVNSEHSSCTVAPVTPPGGGGGTAPPEEEKPAETFCGDNICQGLPDGNDKGLIENMWSCSVDCKGGAGFDELFYGFWKYCFDSDIPVKTPCLWTESFGIETGGNITCGDGVCQPSESPLTCESDCGSFDFSYAICIKGEGQPCFLSSQLFWYIFFGLTGMILILSLIQINTNEGKRSIGGYVVLKTKKRYKRWRRY